ncbi:MAG: hypothetical protein EOO45_23340 [Flavobacterium sp.]|nr:MAG: hypothetical protein EOO45_23340 [Flavobacterium sp.]
MSLNKQNILNYYKQQVQDRIDVFRDMIAALTEDAANDAKGSAGDKHETALSMMHIEQEKLNHKLKEALAHKSALEKIDPASSSAKVVVGSLIVANGMHLFMSLALPKITVDGASVIALSPQSPLGSKLMGMAVGDTFEISGTPYIIETIY